MRDVIIYDKITRQQNLGVACPYCGSYSGHYGYCDQLTRGEIKSGNKGEDARNTE